MLYICHDVLNEKTVIMKKQKATAQKRKQIIRFDAQSNELMNNNYGLARMENGEFVLYQPDGSTRLEVLVEAETVWLTQSQMTMLFQTTKQNVSLHINNIFKEGELEKISVVKDFLTTASDGKKYHTKYYNLDVIISVGYHVKSKRGTLFRIWANSVLKEYLLRGFVVSQRIERLEKKVAEHDKKIDLFVRTALPPVEGVFYDGQIFDAYNFAADLIRSANYHIVLIDNYVDDSVLKMLTKRGDGVKADIITRNISETLAVDLQRYNNQYTPVEIRISERFHDRFLILDDTVYHIGASLKDLGKKLFAFCKMSIPAEKIMRIADDIETK